jgi:hypothetical protein
MRAKITSIFLCTLIASCSSSSPSTTNDKDASSGTHDSATSSSGKCNSVVRKAKLVPATMSSATPPTAKGGSIADGTYVLTSYVIYSAMAMADGGSMGAESETASISGSTWQVIGGDGQSDVASTQTFTASSGDAFLLKTSCGDAASLSGTYTATASEILLISGDAAAATSKVMTFEKQ